MVSLVSSVTVVMRLPTSWTSSMADWPHVPAVSIATGTKMCETESYVFGCLAGRCSVDSCSCFPCCVAYMGLGIGVRNNYIPCHWFASCPRKQCGAIRSFAILLQQTRRLFDHWYLGSFDCPAEDVVHVMMALLLLLLVLVLLGIAEPETLIHIKVCYF